MGKDHSKGVGNAVLQAVLHFLAWFFGTGLAIVAVALAYLLRFFGTLLHTIGERIEHTLHK